MEIPKICYTGDAEKFVLNSAGLPSLVFSKDPYPFTDINQYRLYENHIIELVNIGFLCVYKEDKDKIVPIGKDVSNILKLKADLVKAKEAFEKLPDNAHGKTKKAAENKIIKIEKELKILEK